MATSPVGAPPPPNTSAIESQYAANMALQEKLGELNLKLGFSTALASAKEALGLSCKNRTEACKQLC
jgi:hypothetical protein